MRKREIVVVTGASGAWAEPRFGSLPATVHRLA